MFTITKSKGKAYRTDDPAKAMHAYGHKHSLSIYHGNEIVRTKWPTGELSSRKHVDHFENKSLTNEQ